MIWQQWVLLVWFTFSAFTLVGSVGRPRKPLEPGAAVVGLAIIGILITVLLTMEVS